MIALSGSGRRRFTRASTSGLMPRLLIVALIMLVLPESAFAAEKAPSGNMVGGAGEAILVAQIALLLLVGRGLGELMQRAGQSGVIGQLLAGLILGPTLFGWLWPWAHHLVFPESATQKSLIAGLSNVGVLMLLLLTGMETDLKLARKVGAPALTVAAAGVTVPFLCGLALGFYLPQSLVPNPAHRLVAALFLGTALSISSIKIVAVIVREMNFMRRNLGQIIIASAIMEDTAGWVIISLTLGIAGIGGLTLANLAKPVIGTAIFLVLSYTVGRRLVFWLIRWVNDTFASEFAVVTAILIVMSVFALITQAIGVNTVLGAFVAGVLVGGSPILSQHIQNQAARSDHRVFDADLLRAIGPFGRPHHSTRSAPPSPHDRTGRGCEHRQVRRRLCGRHGERTVVSRVARARLRHERARQHRSDRGQHRAQHGHAHAQSLHHDCHHGGHHHHDHAADVALVAIQAADEA